MPKFKLGDIVKPSKRFLENHTIATKYAFAVAEVIDLSKDGSDNHVQLCALDSRYPLSSTTWWEDYLDLVG